MACRLAHLLLSSVCSASYPLLEGAAPPARVSALQSSVHAPGVSGAAAGASGAAGGAAATLAVPGAVSNTLSLPNSTGAQMQNLLQAQVASMKRSPSALNPPATLPTVKRASSQKTTGIDQYSFRVLYE